MKISFETPKCILNESRSFNDYDYFLDCFEDARQFYLQSLIDGRTVYIDNSLYERFKYNLGFDEDKYKELIHEFGVFENCYFIVPDKFNDVDQNIAYSKQYRDYTRKILVLHGKTLNELKRCLNAYLEVITPNDIIAMPFGDDVFKTHKRRDLLKELRIPVRTHVLGSMGVTELNELSEVQDLIYSMDTSLPICATMEGVRLNDASIKPTATIYAHYNIGWIDHQLMHYNINFVKSKFERN